MLFSVSVYDHCNNAMLPSGTVTSSCVSYIIRRPGMTINLSRCILRDDRHLVCDDRHRKHNVCSMLGHRLRRWPNIIHTWWFCEHYFTDVKYEFVLTFCFHTMFIYLNE